MATAIARIYSERIHALLVRREILKEETHNSVFFVSSFAYAVQLRSENEGLGREVIATFSSTCLEKLNASLEWTVRHELLLHLHHHSRPTSRSSRRSWCPWRGCRCHILLESGGAILALGFKALLAVLACIWVAFLSDSVMLAVRKVAPDVVQCAAATAHLVLGIAVKQILGRQPHVHLALCRHAVARGKRARGRPRPAAAATALIDDCLCPDAFRIRSADVPRRRECRRRRRRRRRRNSSSSSRCRGSATSSSTLKRRKSVRVRTEGGQADRGADILLRCACPAL